MFNKVVVNNVGKFADGGAHVVLVTMVLSSFILIVTKVQQKRFDAPQGQPSLPFQNKLF